MEQKTRIAIADKNTLVRSGLEHLLGQNGRYQILTAVGTGGEFVELSKTTDFEIGIIGWALPDMCGAQVLDGLKALGIERRIVVYTGASKPEIARRAMKSGARGFCCKTEPPEHLIGAINAVAVGRMSFPYVDLNSLDANPLQQLTDRERELLAAIADGWTNIQLASRFGISQNTVKFHLKNLYDKLNVKNRAMAAALYSSQSELNI